MQALDRILAVVDRVMEVVCHLLLVVITAITVLQVFLRFVLDRPTSWSEELALLLLIWFGMIAIGIAIRRHGHIAIMAVRDRLPPRLAHAVDLFAQLLILGFSLVLFAKSFELIGLSGVQVMPALGISRAWLYYPVLVGGLLMSVNALGNLVLGRVAAPDPETMG
ncbi:TRAP transporter small permease [Geminicoccus roseus]|uniref:TRAP transporter small permease n=1 Tax=Geminicoccus roseus TaxID=404900 RepID=UPI000406CC0D|nr:TRAP transporter small permease [Geminicoccus roseus]